MSALKEQLEGAMQSGMLLESSVRNILQLLERSNSPVYAASVDHLVQAGEWEELNDRFFRTLAFGTGGLRGRTIGKLVTPAENGVPDPLGRPQFPCVGTNSMNFYNISRATQGLVAYLKDWFTKNDLQGRPKIAIAHDTRHFSRDFAELTARVAIENGCDAALFEKPRSTPELSFAVRQIGASAGIVITASHNPPHDNGYKVYFSDGAQVVEPHASGIIAMVNAVESDIYPPLPSSQHGQLEPLGTAIDEAYMERLQTLILKPEIVGQKGGPHIVYTSIHGTGGEIIKPMLKKLGFSWSTVPAQDVQDGRFPTVKSPNPENAEALKMAIDQARSEKADLVVATDPDSDRMGAAAPNSSGEMQLFTGNQIGSLMAYYRVNTLFEQGILTPSNAERAVIIKTFVTTDLQKAIATRYGLRCIETLTGFKYIGAKLGKYENALPEEVRKTYRTLTEPETRSVRLQYSSYYVCGGEESYGYSGADFVRDKDANGATVMFAEVAAYAKSRGLTLNGLLDEIYSKFGFYLEKNGSLTFEGAEGAGKIKKLVDSYASNPPCEVEGVAVSGIKNFATEIFYDVEGDKIPSERMLMLGLTDGRRVAVRPSGTEPKIKFYMFAYSEPESGKTFSSEELDDIKKQVQISLDQLWIWLQQDVDRRLST